MMYVKTFGRPDLFITFTCNPTWPEIKKELIDGQASNDRHDIIARVFKLKLQKLMDLLVKDSVFGMTRCHMYSVEWQKRGLPHAHILLWLKKRIHLKDIDNVVSAEIPDKDSDPILHQIVEKNMIHGPCGILNRNSPCMKDGRCSKKFPKAFTDETQTAEDGYPKYRRRSPDNGGKTIHLKIGQDMVEVDNRWVVPFSPFLSKIFKAHINVEFCNSVKSIKYVCKYVNKGCDMCVFSLDNPDRFDEVKQYEMGRYISTNEAVWRILGFSIHERYPPVQHLAVHLENGQRFFFNENDENLQERLRNPPETTLTAFFKLCQSDDFARQLLYQDVPRYYTWLPSKKFKRRCQGALVENHPGIKSSDTIGRVFAVHPNNRECYYLRILLHHVRGPLSFVNLRTVNGLVCRTYQEACSKLGLLQGDNHWSDTLQEAAVSQQPTKLRDLFAVMIASCELNSPNDLWIKFRCDLSEDYLYHAIALNNGNGDNIDTIYTLVFNQALIDIEDKVLATTGRTIQQFGLPATNRAVDSDVEREILRESSYNLAHLLDFVNENEPKLTPDQKLAFELIIRSVNNESGQFIFLDAPGGTGKTFLTNLILAKIRLQRKLCIAVASSGIAATLLSGGRTAHSTFKLPLNIVNLESPLCNIKRGSGMAKLLQSCKLIVWDECTMSHKRCFEALDRTLRDIRGVDELFGGLTVLICGDFRQTLPVVPRGTPADELNACLKASYLWSSVKQLQLKTNMRVHIHNDEDAGSFASKLLELGNGAIPCIETSTIKLPFGHVVKDTEKLISMIYPNIATKYTDKNWLKNRAILAPRNDTVDHLNQVILGKLPGSERLYLSIDDTVDKADAVYYPKEFLNSLTPTGLPLHELRLKPGVPLILLRNLDPPKLCNGTRLVVKTLMQHIIEATIITGQFSGEHVYIPKIPLCPSDYPFEFKRLQFPVKLSFAMSINKAQGQSIKSVGIHLEPGCFSHGQLYVGCSRVSSQKDLYILASNAKNKKYCVQKSFMLT